MINQFMDQTNSKLSTLHLFKFQAKKKFSAVEHQSNKFEKKEVTWYKIQSNHIISYQIEVN